jgi:hypothetical protein
MKQLLSFMFILIISFSGFSQKPKTQKRKNVIKEAKQSEIANETIMGAPDNQEEFMLVDTLHIATGKPYLFIVDVNKNSAESATINPEEKELIQNFGKKALQIVNVYKYSYIIFENKQTLDISVDGNSYQAFAYWGGNLEDNVQLKEGTNYATEFVAEQMGVNKESSYVVNTRKYKKEVALLENAGNITEKSKEIMNTYLNDLVTPIPNDKGEDASLYEQNLTNIKSIETYFIENNGKKIFLKNAVFNKNQQPILIKSYNRKGVESEVHSFIYKNGMLIKIINGDKSIAVNYDDNRMIFSENIGEANETRVTWLENDVMLEKRYVLMIDDKYQFMNNFTEEKFEDNCITYYLNNSVWTINCSSKTGMFPFVHKYTSFQDGEVLQYRKSKLVKKGDKLFEKYYSSAEQEREKDNFKLWGVFQFNEQNLLSSYDFTKDDVKCSIKINYTFFPKI